MFHCTLWLTGALFWDHLNATTKGNLDEQSQIVPWSTKVTLRGYSKMKQIPGKCLVHSQPKDQQGNVKKLILQGFKTVQKMYSTETLTSPPSCFDRNREKRILYIMSNKQLSCWNINNAKTVDWSQSKKLLWCCTQMEPTFMVISNRLTRKLSAAFSTLIFIHILYTQGNPTVYHYSLELHISCISGPLHLNLI